MKKDGDKIPPKTALADSLSALAMFTQLGISMATCVFVGVMAGKFLDSFFGTSPWLLLIFSAIGGASSIKVMYDTAIKGHHK